MKTCMISDLYYPYILGGVEKCLWMVSESLAKRENVVVISTSDYVESVEELNRVKVYRIKTGNFYSTSDCASKPLFLKPLWHLRSLSNHKSYCCVKKILRKERPDIVHTHNLQPLSPLIFDAIHELKIPHIHELHDYGLLCPRTSLLHGSGKICENPNNACRLYRYLKRLIVDDKPQLIIGPSQFVINKHLECGFFRNTKCQKLPHGVKLPDVEIKKDNDLIDVLYVGQLSKHKGVHILIEAFKQIQRADLRLHICGRGKNEEEFRNLARDNNQIMFHGFVSEKELNRLYDSANILVVPSLWYDNSPTVIYEAFVHGTPVIGSRMGGIPELVHDGENGFLFEPRNVRQLAEILDTLSPSVVASLGKKISRERYGIKKYIGELQGLYRELLR